MPFTKLTFARTSTFALVALAGFGTLAAPLAAPLAASSHREAPGISRSPQVDGTDFYMFRSYEAGREGFVTLLANYNPLQDPYGGPNYFPLDPQAFYEIRISNDGDVVEDLTFRFDFAQKSDFIALEVGDAGATEVVAVPLSNIGSFGPGLPMSNLNVNRTYTVRLLRGPLNNPTETVWLTKQTNGGRGFGQPFDNIGEKSIPEYDRYAQSKIFEVDIPGCEPGRVFAGQRKDTFAVNLGEVFDLVNVTDPLGDPGAEPSDTEDKNVTTLALEIPINCLTEGNGDIINGWTVSMMRRTRTLTESPTFDTPDKQSGRMMQVSRLGNPLVNEVAIGLPDKDLFNASLPVDDAANFLTYVTHPTLPELLEALFGTEAPNNFPRNDLQWVFLTGIPGLNEDGSVGEVMRLNTAIEPVAASSQNNLGVAAGDNAGYPNGRRLGDDVVDISLRAVMGLLCHLDLGVCEAADAPSGLLPFTDGTAQNALMFDEVFPYATDPIPGSPNEAP